MHFLLEIKKYLAGEVTPEAFAETIKSLVDQHGIVIPLNDTPIGGWVRPAGEGARPIKQVRFCHLTRPEREQTAVGARAKERWIGLRLHWFYHSCLYPSIEKSQNLTGYFPGRLPL